MVVAFLVLVLPLNARADDKKQRADALVAQGARLGQQGYFEQAISRFLEAEKLVARAIHYCNIGLAFHLWKRWPQAHLFLEQCQKRAHEPVPRWVEKTRRSVLSKLRGGQFARVMLHTVPAHATFSLPGLLGAQLFVTPVELWLPPGDHRINVQAHGHAPSSVVLALSPTATMKRQIQLTPLTILARTEQMEREDRRAGSPIDLYVSQPPQSRLTPWIVLSSGLVAAAIGGVFHGVAASRRDKVSNMSAGPAADDELKQFQLERGVAIGLYAVGAVVTGVGTYLLFDSSK